MKYCCIVENYSLEDAIDDNRLCVIEDPNWDAADCEYGWNYNKDNFTECPYCIEVSEENIKRTEHIHYIQNNFDIQKMSSGKLEEIYKILKEQV